MLTNLHIENFALIDKLDIEFGEGLNVLTGSTGAGKSIIIGALDLILGGRGSEEIVRTGEITCIVEGKFKLKRREIKNLFNDRPDINSDTIVIRREYKKKGGGRAFIEGSQIAISELRDVAEYLGDILGQHSHQALLNPATHCGYLDRYAGFDDKVGKLKSLYAQVVALRENLRVADRIAIEISDRIDLLGFQVSEIEKSALLPGEEEKLKEERKLLENARKIRDSADLACRLLLDDDGSAIEKIGEAEKCLASISSVSDQIKAFIPAIRGASDSLKDTILDLKNLADKIDENPQRLEDVNLRLDEIFRLKKKYGGSINDILKYADKAQSELQTLKLKERDTKNLNRQVEESLGNLNALAAELSLARKKAAPELEKLVIERLIQMGIPRTQFVIGIGEAESDDGLYRQNGKSLAGDGTGYDIVEFQFCANPGEGLKPLAKIASGGEISRVMLALKNAFLRKRGNTFEVFDEIDVGISGDAAAKVAKQLKELSQKHQVICITHLAQIASVADHHFRVYKSIQKGRAVTRVDRLDRDKRVREIAGLLAGEKISEKAIAGAEELLKDAGQHN